MENQVSVLDYGCGNINSVLRMIERAGGRASVITTAQEIEANQKIIIPGVGAFDYGIDQLEKLDLVESLHKYALKDKKWVMGICLGMQIMCNSSEEGEKPGLGWINAEVRHFHDMNIAGMKVPHMGWEKISPQRESDIFDMEAENRYYFVHSYRVVAKEVNDVIATAVYGDRFVAAFQKGKIIGVQFHPEKSHKYGLELMKKFVSL